jgi:hypothetical protein
VRRSLPCQKNLFWRKRNLLLGTGSLTGFTLGLRPHGKIKNPCASRAFTCQSGKNPCMAGIYRVRRQPPACPVKYPQGERSVFHAGVCRLSGTRAKKSLLAPKNLLLGTGSLPASHRGSAHTVRKEAPAPVSFTACSASCPCEAKPPVPKNLLSAREASRLHTGAHAHTVRKKLPA